MPFDNTTPIYLINLLWKLGLGLGLLRVAVQWFDFIANRLHVNVDETNIMIFPKTKANDIS